MATGCSNFSSIQESLWPVLAAQFPLALLGNGAALYRLATGPRPWHSGTVFAFHLVLSGLLYSLSLPFLAAYYYPPKDWHYGVALCKLERFLFNCNLYGSIFFVTCISLHRFLAIVHPLRLRGRLQPCRAQALSAAVWLLAGLLSAPALHFAELRRVEGVTECVGSAVPGRLRGFYPYSLVLAGLGCVLPFLASTGGYAALLRAVCRNPHLGRSEKRRVGQLVAAGLALYAFSYLPYHICRNLNLHRRLLAPGAEDCGVSRAVHAAAQLTKVLVNLNVCLQPLLYADGCCGTGAGSAKEPGQRLELRPMT